MNLAIESSFMNASFIFFLGITAAQQFPGDSRETPPKFVFGNRLGAEPTHVLGNPGRSLGKGIKRRVTHATLPDGKGRVLCAVLIVFSAKLLRQAKGFEEHMEGDAQRRPVLHLRTKAARKLLHSRRVSLV